MKVEDAITVTVTEKDSDFAGEMLYLIENNDLSFNDIINILNSIAEVKDFKTDRIAANGHLVQVIYDDENTNEI